jgi:cell division protein ZapA (FtsZ GTPase activity inhibitor)
MIREKRHIQLNLRNKSIRVPIIENAKTSQRIAELVDEKLAEIEADSDRIDTQSFALEAAYLFAGELISLQQSLQKDEKDLIKALDSIGSHLQKLLDPASE